MRSSATALRKAYFNLYNHRLFIEGAEIPMVDEKLDEQITEQDIYVAMTTQTDTNRSTKSNYAEEINMALVIVQRTDAAVSKEMIDSVENQILQLMFPSKGNHGLTIDSPFRVTYVKKDNAQTQAAKLEDGGFVIAKQLNFRNHITQ